MNFQLTEEHEQLREMIRDFALNEVAPTASERDENEEFDRAIFDKMAELGLTGIPWYQKNMVVQALTTLPMSLLLKNYLVYVLRQG